MEGEIARRLPKGVTVLVPVDVKAERGEVDLRDKDRTVEAQVGIVKVVVAMVRGLDKVAAPVADLPDRADRGAADRGAADRDVVALAA